MRQRWTLVIVALGVFCSAGLAADTGAGVVPLQGEWGFRLDPNHTGLQAGWFKAALPDRITLPGSTDEAGYGTRNNRTPDLNWLSRIYEYAGPAWYQREIDIPAAWKGKRVTLVLERCHWETRVWVDDREADMQDSLCVAHIHDLGTDLAPGKHRLTLRVDNTLKYNMGDAAHSTSEQTQTNWNGVVGRIELRANDPVWVEAIQVYPDIEKKAAKARVSIRNATGKPARGQVTLQAAAPGGEGRSAALRVDFAANEAMTSVEGEVAIGEGVRLWDEFSPSLYEMTASLSAEGDAGRFADARTVTFGMRKLGIADGKQFTLNGRKIFIRGTLECCIFPRTGYPPTDVDAWLRILTIAKSYGLNHLRFHSWCPPEAAFVAADRMGFLFHVEAPQWVFDAGKDAPRDRFIEEEVKRILDTYGNHPSFGMLCMGNELKGDNSFLQKLVKLGKERDPRHFYTPSTAWSFGENDEYNVALVRGLNGPTTDVDYREKDAKFQVPVISHEVGQWTVYPNLDEVKKYTGVLRPRNFELVRSDLAARGMLDQAAAFTRATGLLMVSLYKEEIEVLLRTPGHAGFQLLDVHDFPGQGTALIGMLDPFWDSKGLITPEAYRRFCGPTVPLLRMKKRTFTADETFTAQAEIAHFGPADIVNARPVWSIKDEQGREVAAGSLPARTLATGNLVPLGDIEAPLAKATAPAKLTVTLSLDGTTIANDWEIWVYPASVDATAPADVVVSKDLDDATLAALAGGKKVLLLASPRVLAKSLPGSFTPVFWSPVWFTRGAGTMSILCDPRHPALAAFPTDIQTNWQWYDLLQNSRSMALDDMPAGLRPIVQVIDNFSRNHRLGNVFEAKVGKGRLVVCSIDLSSHLDTRPAARQLLHSLYAYMDSDAFEPRQELRASTLALLFRTPADLTKMMTPPPSFEGAPLHVKAAAKLPTLHKAEGWNAKADDIVARQKGFDYSVKGSTWRDSEGAAWHDASNLVVKVTCPKGFQGTLYAHFHDWNKLDRVAEVWFQGKDLGTLDKCDGEGVWLAIPVTPQDSKDGKLELSAQPMHTNAMITQIVLKRSKD